MFGLRRKAAVPPASSGAEWRSRGNAALAQGRLQDAAACYRQAVECDASDAPARVNLAYVLLEQGQGAQAAEVLAQALALQGGSADLMADAQFLLGRAQRLQGLPAQAAASFGAALSARPGFTEARQELMLLAQALHAGGRGADALAPLEAILASEPANPEALECRGNVLLELGRCQEALASFEQVLQAHGRRPDALANASAALLRLERHEEALALAEEALRLQPAHRVSLHNRGCALINLLRTDDAVTHGLQATRLYPDDPDLLWSLGVARLLRGDLAAGWQAHEARWRAKAFPGGQSDVFLTSPQWTGEQGLEGKVILLHAEQGLGDSIQFLRYLPLVARRAREVLLHVQAELSPLLTALPANCRLLRPGDAVPGHDLQCPLLSLPCAFGTSLESIPADIPYLSPDAVALDTWRRRVPAGKGLSVGVVWSGNPRHGNDSNRSIALSTFRELSLPGVRFLALQPQVRASDRQALADWNQAVNLGSELHDFADTAALVQALDLVITVDTSVAHLAGALGKPVWVLLPYVPDWRWMLERRESPWYPTARLYRQTARGDWPSVIARVKGDLAALAEGR